MPTPGEQRQRPPSVKDLAIRAEPGALIVGSSTLLSEGTVAAHTGSGDSARCVKLTLR